MNAPRELESSPTRSSPLAGGPGAAVAAAVPDALRGTEGRTASTCAVGPPSALPRLEPPSLASSLTSDDSLFRWGASEGGLGGGAAGGTAMPIGTDTAGGRAGAGAAGGALGTEVDRPAAAAASGLGLVLEARGTAAAVAVLAPAPPVAAAAGLGPPVVLAPPGRGLTEGAAAAVVARGLTVGALDAGSGAGTTAAAAAPAVAGAGTGAAGPSAGRCNVPSASMNATAAPPGCAAPARTRVSSALSGGAPAAIPAALRRW